MRPRGLAAVVVVCALRTLAAATPESEKLFRDGRALVQNHQVAEGCALLDQSAALEPRVGTLLNLGDCREQMGQVASAWSAFDRAHTLAIQLHDVTRAREAERRQRVVQQRLGHLYLDVPAASLVTGLEIRRNGTVVDVTGWNTGVPLDPGTYAIAASAPGRIAMQVNITMTERADLHLVIAPLAMIPVAGDAGSTPPMLAITNRAVPVRFEARRGGLGVALGTVLGTEETLVASLRGVWTMAWVPGGELRAVGAALYVPKYVDEPADASHLEHTTRTVIITAGIEYLYRPRRVPQLAFGGGLGLNEELDFQNDHRGFDPSPSVAVLVTPILVRVTPAAEVGLRVQFNQAGDEPRLIVQLGADWLAW